MLKKGNEIVFVLPPEDSQPANLAIGVVAEVNDNLANCAISFVPGGGREVTVLADSGQAVESSLSLDSEEVVLRPVPGFAICRDKAFMPLAVNEKIAARMIGFSVPFLAESRCHGVRPNRTMAPPYVKLGRSVRYLVTDIHQWLVKHRRVMIDPEELQD